MIGKWRVGECRQPIWRSHSDGARVRIWKRIGRPLDKTVRRLGSASFEGLQTSANLLRLVDKIFWDTVGIGGETRDFLLRPILALKNYEPQLAAALRLLDWGEHD